MIALNYQLDKDFGTITPRLLCRRQAVRSTLSKVCEATPRQRSCDRLLGERQCLERLRQAALADTNRFLTAALARGPR